MSKAGQDPLLWANLLRALRDREPSAAKAIDVQIRALADAVMWKRCAGLVGGDLAQEAQRTVYGRVYAGTLPLGVDHAGRRNQAYVLAIVKSRFQDLRRQRHRQERDCGAGPVELDQAAVDEALEILDKQDLFEAVVVLVPQLAEPRPMLERAVRMRQGGAPTVALELGVELADPQFATCWGQEWRRSCELRRAFEQLVPHLAPTNQARRLRKFLAWLAAKPQGLPEKVRKVAEDDMDEAQIRHMLTMLDHYGVLRRIAKDSGPLGQSAQEQVQMLKSMVALKCDSDVTMSSVLGVAGDAPEFIRKRDALYQAHKRLLGRIAVKVADLTAKGLMSADDFTATETFLRYLRRRATR